jgi:TM2 domain-containing membrane protein YozV
MNIGIVLGGVAVVLGILSKGSEKKLLPQAKRGIIYGTIGIVLGYIVFVSSMHTILTDPTYRQQLNQMSEQMNGQSFDDLLKELGLSDL